MERNNFLIQSNWLTKSFEVNPDIIKEIHKDIIYLCQSKINYYSELCPDTIQLSIQDYIKFKGISQSGTYTIAKFKLLVEEMLKIRGYFGILY